MKERYDLFHYSEADNMTKTDSLSTIISFRYLMKMIKKLKI